MLKNLFCDFNTPDSWFVLTFLVGSFILGLLLGWVLWGEKLKKALADLNAANAANASLQAEMIGLKDKNALLEADLQKANKDVEDLRVAFVNIQHEKGQIDSELLGLKDALSKASMEAGDLRIQLQNLENQNVQLKAELTEGTAVASDEVPTTKNVDESIELEIVDTTAEDGGTEEAVVISGIAALAADGDVAETDEEETAENTEEEVAPAPQDTPETHEVADDGIAMPSDDGVVAPIELDVQSEPLPPTIETTVVEEADALVLPKGVLLNDLKVVEGIGPKVESLLHKSGINTWAQLADTTVEQLKQILVEGGDRFRLLNPGTWPRQAEMLAAGQWDEFKAYATYLVAGVDPGTAAARKAEEDKRSQLVISPKGWRSDDLKTIEGIGPKIEQLLKDAGISYWGQLAETTPTRLREILANGGDRFQMHDPNTWPDQAQLLFNEEWDKFDEFIKFLNKGKNPS